MSAELDREKARRDDAAGKSGRRLATLIGRGVHINSLAVNDHNLLEFGDRVVVGGGVHLSGHTVEDGGRPARRPRHNRARHHRRHRRGGRPPLPGRGAQLCPEVLAAEGRRHVRRHAGTRAAAA